MAVWIPTLGLDCKKCSDSQKELYGCEKETIVPWWEINGRVLNRCPLKVVDKNTDKCFAPYNRYEKGFLPDKGGWEDQAANFTTVIEIIENQLSVIKKQTTSKK